MAIIIGTNIFAVRAHIANASVAISHFVPVGVDLTQDGHFLPFFQQADLAAARGRPGTEVDARDDRGIRAAAIGSRRGSDFNIFAICAHIADTSIAIAYFIPVGIHFFEDVYFFTFLQVADAAVAS